MKNKAKVMQLIDMALTMDYCYMIITRHNSVMIGFVDSDIGGYSIHTEYSILSGATDSGIYYYTADEAIELLSFIANNPRETK